MAEHSLILGTEKNLVATITTAKVVDGRAPRCVALLTNAGVIPRGGPHRMNVRLARHFAMMGIPSVRFDLSGLGDSARPKKPLAVLQQWVADTRAVMDAAQGQLGTDRFFMVGLCSGAQVAHLVALEDPRMHAALLWDLYDYPTLQSRLRTLWYRLQRAGPQRVIARVISRALAALNPPKDDQDSGAAEGPRQPPRAEFARQIQSLVDKGVELHFAFSGGEPDQFNYKGQFRAMFAGHAFVNKVAFTFLELSDHVITRKEAQTAFIDMVDRWLQERVISGESVSERR